MIQPRAIPRRTLSLLALSVLLTGCFSTEPAQLLPTDSQSTNFTANPLPWPARLGDPNHPGIIRHIDATKLRSGRLGSQQFLNPNDDDRRDARAIAQRAGQGNPISFRFEGPGSLIFTPEEGLATGSPTFFKFISATQVDDDSQSGIAAEVQRTWFAFYPAPTPSNTRGLILIVPGMLGTPGPIIETTITYLQKHNYAILRMLSHPSRFTERKPLTINYKSNSDAKTVASILNNRVAEAAYATRAALNHIEQTNPQLKSTPHIALGMSGGAMILPTILALEPNRYQAAIIIAGGANFWEVNDRSNYAGFIRAIEVTWQPEATWPNRRAFGQRYLKASPLDSYHTATRIDHLPILMIQGSLDRAVPSDLGDLLWNQLGKPERWSVPVGHELLFIMFPARLSRVIAWLDQHALPTNTSP